MQCLVEAEDATMDKFAVVWKDFAKMEIIMSYYLFHGTESILEGNDSYAHECAIYARFMEHDNSYD